MDGTTSNDRVLNELSDEELMQMTSPAMAVTEDVEEEAVAEEVTEAEVIPEDDTELPTETETDLEEAAAMSDEEVDAPVVEPGDDSGDEADAGNGEGEEAPAVDDTQKSDKEEKTTSTDETDTSDKPVNYEELYKQIMAPFRANGRDFAPSSPEEVKSLMQFGANYTKKMQGLQPKMKLLRMLEKNELLDEGKLSFLIDLDKKKPDAVAKLLKDAKIDPLDVDTSDEATYKPGNHSIGDDEMVFTEALNGVMATDGGKETVAVINKDWDERSKQAVYKEPAILSLIDQHRGNGLYARISAEIDRQQILGRLNNMPFIEAYKQAGNELQNAGLLSPNPAPQPAAVDTPVPQTAEVTRRREASPSKLKSSVRNGEAARKVSPTPSNGSKTARKAIDPFDLTDDQIMAMNSLKV